MPEPIPPDQIDLLALSLVPGLGPRLFAALLEHFGSAAAVRRASAADLQRVPQFGEVLSHRFAQALRTLDPADELALMAKFDTGLLCSTSSDYPPQLKQILDAPALLYRRGTVLPADHKAVAIVGSRRCTTYGIRVASQIAAGLAGAGYTVVSGLALGIDGIAHQAALDSGGRTLAVLAGGLSSIYPPEHRALAEAVSESGALLSEAPMTMAPHKGLFHSRNRLISGLGIATVLIEANAASGALITARHTLEQGRELYVVPANIDATASAGCVQMLREGGRAIGGIKDLLEDLAGIKAGPSTRTRPIQPPESPPTRTRKPRSNPADASELFPQPPAPPPPPPPAVMPEGLDGNAKAVWEKLTSPATSDELAQSTGLAISELFRVLMVMEMNRHVRRLPGNIYSRAE